MVLLVLTTFALVPRAYAEQAESVRTSPPPLLRNEAESGDAPLGKAALATLLVAAAGVALVMGVRKKGRGMVAGTNIPRLRGVASMRLSPKCTLHLVEADGKTMLVTCGDGVQVARLDVLPSDAGFAGAPPK